MDNNISREEEKNQKHESFLDFGYFPNSPFASWQNQAIKVHNSNNLHHLAVMNESSQPCSNRVAVDLKKSEKKAFTTGPANNTAVPNENNRTAPAPVVGWPPIRSFRKNFTSGSSSKLASDSTDDVPTKVSDRKTIENCPKTLFVKINMDGVPIGRKVDLKAYDSYEKLSYAVDELFRGLLAVSIMFLAQGESPADEDGKIVGGLLNGNREYTLVYEDNEGDRMLVGDVPWK
ncbi:auxin-responsive protein iaa18 [Phtheirospermum japonicum]|uniref:Auxin-responsive protein n=1 Tax=Phtheirospermum japonicum TaxID=374723 RepID=A0A830BN47_9LAMI|nr:auxin-responsive protein iaa18 [Phtheirospermum japonicum]